MGTNLDLKNIELGDVSVFVRVVEVGGFSAAARSLQLPKSGVSRRVARLEQELGTRLLHRTTRSISLTDSGRRYYDIASAALGALDEAAHEAASARTTPTGVLRVCAPPDIGAEVLPAIVSEFVTTYPEVRVEVELSAETPSLIDGGYDLAIRGGPQTDSRLVTRKLQDARFGLYASSSYVAKNGRPRTPSELARHNCILFRAKDGKDRWKLSSDEATTTVAVRGSVGANSMAFVRQAAIMGAGIAQLPEVLGEQVVNAGALLRLLPAYFSTGNALHIVYPSREYLPLKVRAFRDFLIERFPS